MEFAINPETIRNVVAGIIIIKVVALLGSIVFNQLSFKYWTRNIDS